MSLGAWHQNVLSGFEGIDRTLAVNHDGMLQMLDLWGLYSHLLLCNVAPLPPTSPMELDAFKDLQHSHCEKVVQALKKKWFPAVLEIFRREMQQEEEGNNGGGPEGSPLLAAVSTLMSNQLRGLLTASIQTLVSFMERYEQTSEEEADLHSELVHDIPGDRPPRLLTPPQRWRHSRRPCLLAPACRALDCAAHSGRARGAEPAGGGRWLWPRSCAGGAWPRLARVAPLTLHLSPCVPGGRSSSSRCSSRATPSSSRRRRAASSRRCRGSSTSSSR